MEMRNISLDHKSLGNRDEMVGQEHRDTTWEGKKVSAQRSQSRYCQEGAQIYIITNSKVTPCVKATLRRNTKYNSQNPAADPYAAGG